MWPKDMTPAQLKSLQKDLNRFTEKYLRGVNKLKVDGENGPMTQRRIRAVKYFAGLKGTIGKQSTWVDKEVRWKIDHPRYVRKGKNRRWDLVRVARGTKRRVEERVRWRKNRYDASKHGVANFEGKPVAKAALAYLNWARDHGWRGGLNSGWRSPSYSRSLCMRICGAPVCPGRCAGTTSNHVGSSPDRFSIDVSDYTKFAETMRSFPGKKIFNALGARDPWHFSPSGR